MKQKRTSYAFLMEMLCVCAFFLISACIFVMVFAKAEQISRQAEVLNEAVQAASNVMEEAMALNGAADSILEQYSTDDFHLELEQSLIDGLLSLTVSVIDADDQSVIYSLEGARALGNGGAS